MADIKITKKNHAQILIQCEDPGIHHELKEYFSFYVPGYKFMPKFKSGMWDGRVSVYDLKTRCLQSGLFDEFLVFCEKYSYRYEIVKSDYGVPGERDTISISDLEAYIARLKLPYEVRDYQFDIILEALNSKTGVCLSPTGSGKSLIIYIISRYIAENFRKKVLITVPTTSLVNQLASDFQEYGLNSDKHVHKIYSGKEKQEDKPFTISTWQSIYKLTSTYFSQYGAVLLDEAHNAKADSLTGIMGKAYEAEYRIGLTGTLDGNKTNELVIRGSLGPIIKGISTKELQDLGYLAELDIKMLKLKYSEFVRKGIAAVKDYQKEINFIVSNTKRNKFIRNLACSTTGNTLILFTLVEKHGKILNEMLQEKNAGKKVFYIHGGTDADTREDVRRIVSTEKNCIILASYGTFSTGINAPSIENIIFASPYKSIIKVLQSIGRGLRLHHGKEKCNLFDLWDDMTHKSKDNYLTAHASHRLEIYAKQEFNYKIVEVEIDD